ncbi:LacI family DNA-binding transcriptional regulator [Halobacillus kuroshimensis]|uniref:LacI family DNA-binding transcriptional regulator n=1 Tax=Halobacillus kuroshimensis TaxID=302481 RepID=UPI000420F830|nr:LacI family DNA-binding transcriptional regulator [Halobacillus kuroshimensis]
MPNIRDIAESSGVSTTTVSRVINNHPYVSDEKREAVRRAIELHNYQKNINAVHLSTGKTFLIGVVVPFTDHPYFGRLLKGIAQEALNNNYKLILFQTNYDPGKEVEAMDMLKHKQIDALIICSRVCEWSMISKYLCYGPIVLCEDIKEEGVSSTFVDHYESFSKALAYLYDKGYDKIGYCVGRMTGTNSKQREKAYKDFHDQHNFTINPDYIFSQSLYFEDGIQIVQELRELPVPPTALLVTSDQIAAGIVTCCEKEQISIPGQLAIIGFDNQPIAKFMDITTIEIPLEKIGQKLFLQSLDTEHNTHQEISTRLIERKTV